MGVVGDTGAKPGFKLRLVLACRSRGRSLGVAGRGWVLGWV